MYGNVVFEARMEPFWVIHPRYGLSLIFLQVIFRPSNALSSHGLTYCNPQARPCLFYDVRALANAIYAGPAVPLAACLVLGINWESSKVAAVVSLPVSPFCRAGHDHRLNVLAQEAASCGHHGGVPHIVYHFHWHQQQQEHHDIEGEADPPGGQHKHGSKRQCDMVTESLRGRPATLLQLCSWEIDLMTSTGPNSSHLMRYLTKFTTAIAALLLSA
jgi:hypothetical protein